MKKFLLPFIFAGSLLLAFSCDEAEETGSAIDRPGEFSELSPSEHQAKLDDIGAEFMSYFDVFEYTDVIQSIEDLIDYFENAPVEGLPQHSFSAAAQAAGVILKTVETKNPAALYGIVPCAAAYKISISEMLGGSNGVIYTYDSRSNLWRVNETADYCIVFEYDDAVIEMEYSPSSVDYRYEFDGERTIVEIPSDITVDFSLDSVSKMSLRIKPNLSSDNLTVEPEVALTLGELVFKVAAEADGTQVGFGASIASGSKKIFELYTRVLIDGFTDLDNWLVETDYGTNVDESYFVDNLINGEFSVQILNAKLAGFGDIRKIIDTMERTEPEMDEEMADILNDNVEMFLMYTDENAVIADFKLQAVEGYCENCEMVHSNLEAVLVFADESKVSIESYFNNSTRFADTIKAVNDFIEDINRFF